MRYQISRLFSRQNFFSIAFLALIFSGAAQAQTTKLPDNLPMPELSREVKAPAVQTPKVATGNDLYCAGYISANGISSTLKIIGAEEENHVAHFSQGEVVYINAMNAREDTLYSIVRPMGELKNPHNKKAGESSLGQYIRELGVLRVFATQGQTATARIIFSCGPIQFGDLLVPFEERRSPNTDMTKPLPRYQQTSGQKPGRIVYQREQKEVISPRDVVYIDLGTGSGLKVGDKFTIFRPTPDDVSIVRFRDDDITIRRSGGYESDKFKGGRLSNDHPYENRQKVKDTRPPIPQKILGELVVIDVQGKSATAVVTRVTQEVHTGDYIEALQ